MNDMILHHNEGTHNRDATIPSIGAGMIEVMRDYASHNYYVGRIIKWQSAICISYQ